MKAGLRAFIVGLGALLLLAGLGLGLGFPGSYWELAGLVLLGPMTLILGFGLGPWAGLCLGLAALVFTICLGLRHTLPADGIMTALALECASILFPRILAEAGRREEQLFTEQHGPVAAERDTLRKGLMDLRGRAAQVEREGRETDAMFHIGREIGKLLTLADTVEFTHEILRDTLKQPDAAVEPAFAVVLVEEERSAMRVEVVEGLEEAQAAVLGADGGDNAFYRWLKDSLNPVLVRSIAAEPGLKGSQLPAGARGLLSVPLIAERRAIGWVLVFDLGGGGPSEEEVSNLGILCSQLAIGLEKALLYDRLQRLSVTDGLTGLTVHRHFQSRLDEELKRSERYREPLSLIMADIDHFKRFNDTWGHLVGDQVLRAVAEVLRKDLGAPEMAVRYGGEEFVLVLPKTPKAAALARAETLREGVKALEVESDGRRLAVTISLGVATYPDDAMTKPGLIDRADEALYRSKQNGRDQVSAA